ncbi:F-box protein interaction domain protein [Medicago truncatula]|uniref:F-box protein interaction domain protein n=1 Tax=Medicago truncatula TaxID=3880 RepID=A0A072VIJ6_MEDTR|nr:F-box protein interaction domain protein [Medicago truncatula]
MTSQWTITWWFHYPTIIFKTQVMCYLARGFSVDKINDLQQDFPHTITERIQEHIQVTEVENGNVDAFKQSSTSFRLLLQNVIDVVECNINYTEGMVRQLEDNSPILHLVQQLNSSTGAKSPSLASAMSSSHEKVDKTQQVQQHPIWPVMQKDLNLLRHILVPATEDPNEQFTPEASSFEASKSLAQTVSMVLLDSLFTYDSSPTLLNPIFLLPKSDFDLTIEGSCRGFILLHSSSNIYLWNPSTRVHRQLPLPLNHLYADFYGFGYDKSTDDYLVVSLSYDYLGIFSLRANAWNETVGTTHLAFCSEVSPSSSSIVYPVVETLFHGAIHWLTFRYDIRVNVIVAFLLMERKLLDIPLPVDIIDYDDFSDQGLWVFRGFLSLWVLRRDTLYIWVMEEYKVHSSWTKTLVLTMDTIPRIFPICCTKTGDIIGTNSRTGLIKYDDEGEFLEHNYYCKDSSGFRLAMYTESLLSLPDESGEALEDCTN